MVWWAIAHFMAVCTICTGGCSYILFISLSFTVTVSHIHLQSETQTCTGACMHIHFKQTNAMQLIGVRLKRANPPRSKQHVYTHISVLWCVCVLVPQVFTGPYSIDGDCLWWLFCTGNHHSHRHLKDNDALWCNSGKNKGLCARAVLGGVYVFLLETPIYAC